MIDITTDDEYCGYPNNNNDQSGTGINNEFGGSNGEQTGTGEKQEISFLVEYLIIKGLLELLTDFDNSINLITLFPLR